MVEQGDSSKPLADIKKILQKAKKTKKKKTLGSEQDSDDADKKSSKKKPLSVEKVDHQPMTE